MILKGWHAWTVRGCQILEATYATPHWTVEVNVRASATTIKRLIRHIDHKDNTSTLQPFQTRSGEVEEGFVEEILARQSDPPVEAIRVRKPLSLHSLHIGAVS